MSTGHYAKPDRGGKPMTLSQPCTRNGCAALAVVTPKLLVPILGHPRYRPYEVLLDLQVCVPHFRELRVEAFLTKLVRGGCKHAMRQAGAEPDFAAARLKPLHVMSKEFLRFQKEQRGEVEARGSTIVIDGLNAAEAWIAAQGGRA